MTSSVPRLSQPLVSFTVTAYNTEKYIAECLESILQQQGDYDFEIIVVDDASSDSTEQVVKQFTDPRIRYIRHTKNQGAFVTVNRGFAEARGKYIARIDSDDRYASHFLASTIPLFEAHQEVGLIYGDIATMDEFGHITSQSGNVCRHNRPPIGNELIPLLMQNYLPAPTTIARREAWEKVLPVPDGFSYCDWYLSLGIARDWMFCYVDQVLADYRIHSQNMHRSMIKNRMGERITFQVLDRIFDKGEELSTKKWIKAEVYAQNYLSLADKYFGCHMNVDARRCYLKAISYRPSLIKESGVARHLLGSIAGTSIYEKSKLLAKSLRKKMPERV